MNKPLNADKFQKVFRALPFLKALGTNGFTNECFSLLKNR